jgi:hypothetical protein
METVASATATPAAAVRVLAVVDTVNNLLRRTVRLFLRLRHFLVAGSIPIGDVNA